jgi:bifunctional DNase/RNase
VVFIPVEVVGVRIEMPSNQPIVLLKEIEGSRFLPIWVGAHEASSIAFALQDIAPARPLTHELIGSVIESTGAFLTAVHVTAMRDGIFYAELLLRNSSGELPAVSARPSDAIALALRVKANILVSHDLMDSAGIQIPSTTGGESEVEAFKEFLDQINPEDFA